MQMKPSEPASGAPASRALVPTLVFLGMVAAVVSSIGAPMIPTIAAQYRVALATPTMGRLGDGPHRRAVIVWALVAITAGNVLAALPLGFHMLLVGRALMGAGMGLTPLTMAAARDPLTGERARSAVAILSITNVAGVGLGYPVTGLVADAFGYEVPSGSARSWAARRSSPRSSCCRLRAPGRRRASTGSGRCSSRRRSRACCSR